MVRDRAVGAMTIVSVPLTLCVGFDVSVTLAVMGALPAAVGMPLTVQPVRVKPAGNVPEVMEQA